jgi:quinol monooxygenase YgiN
MILVEGQVRLAAGEIDRLADAMRAQIEATRAEEGCELYAFAVDVLDPQTLRISERWTDQAALDAHMKAPHMAAFNQALGTARIESVKVDAYQGNFIRTVLGG